MALTDVLMSIVNGPYSVSTHALWRCDVSCQWSLLRMCMYCDVSACCHAKWMYYTSLLTTSLSVITQTCYLCCSNPKSTWTWWSMPRWCCGRNVRRSLPSIRPDPQIIPSTCSAWTTQARYADAARSLSKWYLALHTVSLDGVEANCVFVQWVYILDGVHKVVGWCGISAIDPALTAEVVLRLALVFEASAALDEKKRIGERTFFVCFISLVCKL